jgi:hypothetical protein
MKRNIKIYFLFAVAALLVISMIMIYVTEPEYAYMPREDEVLQVTAGTQMKIKNMDNGELFHIDGRTDIKTEDGKSDPSGEEEGKINDSFLHLGREMFYKETFGNEVFLTDIIGIVDGALTIPNMAKAILQLRGEGTTNLRVELAKDVVIGGKQFKKGQFIDTGIDVPKGAYAPLGMPVKLSEGKVKVGISCVARHATVDYRTKKVIEGAPNRDLNAGLLMALATNSTVYFTHADVENLANYLKNMKTTVTASDGKTAALPDPKKLEEAVDGNPKK